MTKEMQEFDPKSPLPHKQAFFPIKGVYFDSGVQHPVSRGCVFAAKAYLEYKGFHTDSDLDPVKMRTDVIRKYARLINAEPEEISIVGSTTEGENLIMLALELTKKGGRIITDDLHYFGSYQIFGELGKSGVEVHTIRNRNGMIDYADYEAAIDDRTTLVCVSGVSTFNGHQHDLKHICALAHKHGALVYADVIHQVGATPLDVKACGVDFCAAGTFKWLMADQGCGFLYVKQESMKHLVRPWYGKRQVRNLVTHVFPGDDVTDDNNVYEYDLAETCEGYFSIWSEPRIVIAQLNHSLDYIQQAGVERIMEYRIPILVYLRRHIENLGYRCLTPEGSITPLLAFECHDARKKLVQSFNNAGIKASIYKGHFRIAISVFNDMDDAELLVDTLTRINQAE